MLRRINLLYFTPTFTTGGSERLVAELVTHLDADSFRVSLCTQQSGVVGEALRTRGYPLHVLADPTNGQRARAAQKLRFLGKRVARLRAILERERIDVVHTHHLGPLLHTFLGSIPRRGWRWVHTEHNRPDVDVHYPRWLVGLCRRLLASPDVVTGVSDAVGTYILRETRATPERVRVIPNGVDVAQFGKRYDGATKRRELGIPAHAWVIGLVANLRPEKNHDLLLRAFARLLPAVPHAYLILVGDGVCRAQLEALAAALGVADNICFLGDRPDVPQLLATFDVYCLPSWYEGMPLSILEAMSAAKPIVATRVIGIREVVSDGHTGLLVSPDDPESLATALLRLQRDPALREKLAGAGCRYVNTHARLEDMVNQYAALYAQVLSA